ncbi:MAG: hypothetical protein K1X28_04175 [Parachlamydiales bacterium]|nr:hypothetical protein [Parachlamydiales bacterium]
MSYDLSGVSLGAWSPSRLLSSPARTLPPALGRSVSASSDIFAGLFASPPNFSEAQQDVVPEALAAPEQAPQQNGHVELESQSAQVEEVVQEDGVPQALAASRQAPQQNGHVELDSQSLQAAEEIQEAPYAQRRSPRKKESRKAAELDNDAPVSPSRKRTKKASAELTKRERNAISARRYRESRKAKEISLTNRVEHLTNKNAELVEQIRVLNQALIASQARAARLEKDVAVLRGRLASFE